MPIYSLGLIWLFPADVELGIPPDYQVADYHSPVS